MTDLKMLIDLAKSEGLKRLKFKDIEFEFFVSTPQPEALESGFQPSLDTNPVINEMPSEDDFLMWSTDGPLPSERRKLAQEQE